MDRWEGNDDWPRKRIRLEPSNKCQISYEASQRNIDDKDREHDASYAHGVYGKEVRGLNLGLNLDPADYDGANPLSWTDDTHQHLAINHHVTSSTVLTQSTVDMPGVSNLSTHSGIWPSDIDGGPKEAFADEVCFGMVILQLLRGPFRTWDY